MYSWNKLYYLKLIKIIRILMLSNKISAIKINIKNFWIKLLHIFLQIKSTVIWKFPKYMQKLIVSVITPVESSSHSYQRKQEGWVYE